MFKNYHLFFYMFTIFNMLKKLLLPDDMKTVLITIFFTFIHSPHFFHIHTKHWEMTIVQRQVHPTSRILSSITNNTALMPASESVGLVSSTNAANVGTLMILVNVFPLIYIGDLKPQGLCLFQVRSACCHNYNKKGCLTLTQTKHYQSL